MTKSEVIKKTTRLAGIPETEAKRFFEMLLEKVYSRLKKNNIIRIDEIGEFRLGMFENDSQSTDQFETEFILLNPVISENKFVLQSQYNTDKIEPLLFQIPKSHVIEENLIDRHFSLSIDKPVIPLGEFNRDDLYYIPTTGYSYIKTLENEAQKILDTKGKIEILPDEEEELVMPSSDEWQVVSKKRDNPFKKEYQLEELEDIFANELIEESDENIPWNFGEIVFDEDKISDRIIEEELTSDKDDSLSWDFGKTVVQTETESIELPHANTEQHIIPDEELTEENQIPDVLIKNEEKIEPISSVENKTDIFEHYHDTSKEQIVAEKDVEIFPDETTEEFVETPDKLPEESSPDFTEEEIAKYKKYEYQAKKRATGVFWVALAGMLIIPVFIYYVWTTPSIKDFVFGNKKEPVKVVEEFNPTIIERDYSIPVAIPFEASTPVVQDQTPNLVQEETNQEIVKEPVQTATPTVTPAVEQGEFTRVKDLIFSRGNVFYVQTSSWQTLYSANRDSSNYVRRGYKPHIISSFVQNLGRTQHRVVVGPFESISKAEEFAKTIQ